MNPYSNPWFTCLFPTYLAKLRSMTLFCYSLARSVKRIDVPAEIPKNCNYNHVNTYKIKHTWWIRCRTTHPTLTRSETGYAKQQCRVGDPHANRETRTVKNELCTRNGRRWCCSNKPETHLWHSESSSCCTQCTAQQTRDSHRRIQATLRETHAPLATTRSAHAQWLSIPCWVVVMYQNWAVKRYLRKYSARHIPLCKSSRT